MQDKSGEETDKVKKNIPKTLAGNKTAVVIRVRIEVIKGWKEAKEGGSEKEEEKGTERRKISIRERERE